MFKKGVIFIFILIIAMPVLFFLWKSFTREKTKSIVINNQAESEDILDEVGTGAKNQNSEPDKNMPSDTEEKAQSSEKAEPSDTGPNIINKLVNWGFQESSGRNIDAIIIHSSYDAVGNDPYDADGLIQEYKSYRVSPHYLIDRDGKIYRLVEEKNIAYHAGVGKLPDGRTNVNEISIGIELMNTKTGEFTSSQYEALNKLIKNLKSKYSMKYVLGHNQIAPGRKDDPWNFDWNKIK